MAVPPPVPALPDTERRTTYNISGSVGPLSVNFAIYGDSTDYTDWVEVWLNGVMMTSGWTLSSPTGSLATIARPITDAVINFNVAQTGTVQIVGARRPRRTAQFTENAGVAARDMNQVLTDAIAMLREVWDKINDTTGRIVQGLPGETMAMLPSASNRANMNAIFDALGNLTAGLPASGTANVSAAMQPVVGAATLALAQAAFGFYFPSNPFEFPNSVNTVLQIADPGIGSPNRNSYENVFFYDGDGSGILGPGQRTDLEVITLSWFNLFISHQHLRFKQPAYSGSRPSAQTLWAAVGAGSFSVNNTSSFGGMLTISTNTSAAGDGGTVSQDYNPIGLPGTKMAILMYPAASTDQVIEFGFFFDVNNKVYLSRSDLTGDGGWVAHCLAAGVATSVASGVNSGVQRTIFCIDYDGTNVNFWIGNSNNTIIKVASINTNIPSLALNYTPYVSITSQGGAVNRQLNITDWYTISNG